MKRPRVAVMLGELPSPVEGGSGPHLVAWAALDALARAGHEVVAGAWLKPASAADERQYAQRKKRLAELGVRVHPLRDTRVARVQRRRVRGIGAVHGALDLLRVTFRPGLVDFFPRAVHRRQMHEFLEAERPDVLVGCFYGTLAPAYGMRTPPRVSMVVDLPHLVTRFRWETTPRTERRRWVRGALSVWAAPRQRDWMVRLLRESASVVEFAAHHADWLRLHGVPHCQYLPAPVPDLGGPDWRAERTRAQADLHKPRVALIGNLRGAATRPGLYTLAHEVLPRLERQFGPDGFEVHIIGKYGPPDDLRSALSRPSVRLRGFVEDVRPEFFAADVLFVPTPIELGTRTRIIVGASFGACTVAHSANVLGIPEFRHDQDILVGATGPQLAEQLMRALGDPALRARLGDEARRTFETRFSPETAGARFVAEVERVAASGTDRRPPRPLEAAIPA